MQVHIVAVTKVHHIGHGVAQGGDEFGLVLDGGVDPAVGVGGPVGGEGSFGAHEAADGSDAILKGPENLRRR